MSASVADGSGRWRWRAAVVCLLAASIPAWPAQTTLHVSPRGSDGNPGTSERPFQTITKARDAVRKLPRDAGSITVLLHDGTYAIEKTILFEPRDSGDAGRPVVYRAKAGETPVISGGIRITGWQRDGDIARWKARANVPDFRQLYVDGQRAVRARGEPPPDLKPDGAEGYRSSLAAMADWVSPKDIEFCYPVVWCHTRCKVESIRREGDTALIRMQQPWFQIAREKEGVQIALPAYMENAFELLDKPGEWHFDRQTRTVYYIPLPGQDLTRIEVIAPGIERLVELRGTLDRPVAHIQFEGLTFEHAGWLRPSAEGLVDLQANFTLASGSNQLRRDEHLTMIHNEAIKSPANVVCHGAKDIRFEGCTFRHLGGAGLDLESGAQSNVVNRCHFFDISGTAIQIGDVLREDHHPTDPRRIVRGNVVSNCDIHDVAKDYEGGVGIFAGYTQETRLAHNHIHHLPYSGISMGWGWGEEDAGGGAPQYHQPFKYEQPTPAKSNRIEFNHIHHVMQTREDGGAIYTLGNMPGTIIRANHIHDAKGAPGGIYLDEGSGFIEITGNTIYRVRTPMNYNNRAQDRIATCKEHDNSFGQPDPAVIRQAGPESEK